MNKKWSVRLGGYLLLALLLIGMVGSAPTVADPEQEQGTISVSPSTGPRGMRVLVTGSFPGYGDYDHVRLWWNDRYSGRPLGGVGLRADGSFALTINIPPEAPLGTHQIIADVNYGYAQASADFDVTLSGRQAAYVYDTDQATAGSYQELLESHGISTTLVSIDQVAQTNFAAYDLVLAGPDSGSMSQWGSPAAVTRLRQSGKPILGLGGGGYALFGQLDLDVGYPHGVHGTRSNLIVVDGNAPVFKRPYNLGLQTGASLSVYPNTSSAVMVSVPNPTSSILLLGREVDQQTRYLAAAEEGRYLFWGYDAAPSALSFVGRDLLANVVWNMLWNFDIDTLILTDYNRMEFLGYDSIAVSDLENDINYLRGLPKNQSNMVALHRDLSNHAPNDLQTACNNWEGSEGDVALTNTCVEAIDDYIENLKGGFYPNIYYVILVGAHEIIPMKVREQDHLISAQEKNWGNNLPGASSYMHDLYSTPGAVNGWGHYLTDSIYGDLSSVSDGWGSDSELIPELAVGRLVETPEQISDLIDTYIASNAYFSRSNRVSIASDDYVDGGTLAVDYMGSGTDDALVQNSFNSTDVPPKLNGANDLVYLGGHGNYNSISTGGGDSFMAGNHATRGDTAALNDMPDAVIVTSGCHNGVNFGDQLYHAPDAGTTYSEFPQEFAERLVGVYVGATGYTIISSTGGDTDVTKTRHNEKLSTYVIKHLDQDGNITAGEAFRRAINSYVTDVGSIGTMERRVIAITTLYGIPNYRAPIQWLPFPWEWREYWLEPIPFDPPPYLDPLELRIRVVLDIRDWTIQLPGAGQEWYLQIAGAAYGGAADEPLVPVFKTGLIMPPGSRISGVEWDQAASEYTNWVAEGAMYVPVTSEDPLEVQAPVAETLAFTHQGLFPEQTYAAFTTTTAGGAGTVVGLSIIPLQHDSQTLSTTLWTRLVFTLTCQAGESTDTDGDGLPGYWENSRRLNSNSAIGEDGAQGNPDDDGLDNEQEFDYWCDPRDPDTDNDGWSDGKEVEYGTNPINPGSFPRFAFLPAVFKNTSN